MADPLYEDKQNILNTNPPMTGNMVASNGDVYNLVDMLKSMDTSSGPVTADVVATNDGSNCQAKIEILESDSELTKSELEDHDTKITTLRNDLDDLGDQVQAIQSDVNSLKSDTHYGIEADYATHYGILDCPNGLIDYNATGKEITINPGIVLQLAGATTKTTIASEIKYTIDTVGKVTLFLVEGQILEAGDVYYTDTEPQDGVSSYLAWYSPKIGKWQFKSNDTGNVWRMANATPIANVNSNGSNILSINYIGYRILDDDIIAQQSEIENLLDLIDSLTQRVEALENK